LSKLVRQLLATLVWIIIWQLVAIIIHNKILLAGPLETVSALAALAPTRSIWSSIWQTTGRILLGFLIGSLVGIILAYIASTRIWVEEFIKPLVSALKSIPVASFVILLLIWFGSRNISVIICAMVVFPILYLNTLEGLKSTDIKMLEMARVYRMPKSRVLRYIYLPQLTPFFKSAFKLAIGMSFKSGIAAEVIGQPLNTIGNGLYLSKIYLETADLFAWTIVVVLISFVCERIISVVIDAI
jgi:NitT/TauT family transport system permease protein